MVIYTHAGPEISVASTKAYMVQISVMYLLAYEIAYANGRITKVECKAHVAGLLDIPEAIEKAIELKHGTISLVTDQMPVIAVATQKRLIEKTVSNIKEVKARGAMVILVCEESADVASDVADHIIRLPKVNDQLIPMVAAVPLQLIAYYTAVLKGCDVDKPRNLAKSVTVE